MPVTSAAGLRPRSGAPVVPSAVFSAAMYVCSGAPVVPSAVFPAAMYVCIYIYIYIYILPAAPSAAPTAASRSSLSPVAMPFRPFTCTRYYFTSSRLCTNQSSFHPSIPPALPTVLSRLLGNITRSFDLPCVCHTPYNIGNGNVV